MPGIRLSLIQDVCVCMCMYVYVCVCMCVCVCVHAYSSLSFWSSPYSLYSALLFQLSSTKSFCNLNLKSNF